MDYKKKYEEALERARKYYGGDEGALVCIEDMLECIFPELRESEDERIRKCIASYIHRGVFNEEEHPKALRAIEWLEKQKDSPMPEDTVIFQKGVAEGRRLEREGLPYWQIFKGIGTIVPDDYILVKFGKGYKLIGPGDTIEIGTKFLQVSQLDNLPKEEKQKEQKPILEVFGFKVGDAVRLKDGDGRKHIIKSFEEVEGVHGPNFYHVEFKDDSARDGIYPDEKYPNGYYTRMEKFEEEQKPIEWSEEDDRHRLNCLSYFNGIAKSSPYYEDYLWLKSIKNRGNSPKSNTNSLSEWNENDESAFGDLMWCIEQARKSATVDEMGNVWYAEKWIKNRLKSLRPQQKQEWTEEDKKRYISIRTVLEASAIIENEEYDADVDWLRDMVNSVKYHKPHWKPSEEQMRALQVVVDEHWDVDGDALYSLYTDLKELM